MRIIYLLFFGFVLIGCNGNKAKGAIDSSRDKTTKKKVDDSDLTTRLFKHYIPNPTVLGHHEENRIIDYAIENSLDLKRSSSGLYYMTTTAGNGKALSRTESLTVDYKGTFLDDQIFDSSYDRGKPIVFKIGEMIAGWNEGLQYCKHGDEVVLIVPSRLGYGSTGYPGFVPPDKILRFDMKIY